MNNQELFQQTANQFGVSVDAVKCMWDALRRGHGTMAQFNIQELGGSGQWMAGGMTMVGDMFNYGLKSKVDGICYALSEAAKTAPPDYPSGGYGGSFQSQSSGYPGTNFASQSSSGNWWPSDLGFPNSVGSQNNLQYAYFSGTRRLAVNQGGSVTIYDTLDHNIGGVSQQQGGSDSLTLSSQYGTIRVADLPVISSPNQATQSSGSNAQSNEFGYQNQQQNNAPEQPQYSSQSQSSQPFQQTQQDSTQNQPSQSNWQQPPLSPLAAAPEQTQAVPESFRPQSTMTEDPISLLEKLGKLRDAGILTDDEFNFKKSELLKRI